jgi:hypothetical protein
MGAPGSRNGNRPFATPASATLQIFVDVNGATFIGAASDSGCNNSGSPTTIQLADRRINGVKSNGEFDQSMGNRASDIAAYPGLTIATVTQVLQDFVSEKISSLSRTASAFGRLRNSSRQWDRRHAPRGRLLPAFAQGATNLDPSFSGAR